MSDKRERNYYYVRYIPSNLAIGDTLVWSGTEWVNTSAGGGGDGGGDITGAANVGTGEGSVFRDETTGVLNLKTLKQGTNITLTNNTSDVTIAASGGGAGEANTGANVGTGTGTIFRDKTGVTLNLKTLLAGSNVTLTNNANDVTIAAAAGAAGDITGASNVGSGTGQVFRDEVAGVLNLKTLLAGSNITLTNNANDVTIAASAGTGEANTGANVGSGTGTIFRDKTGVTLNLKTLLAGSGITITNNANDITLASTGGGSWDANATETLTNKTINADSNTITNIEDADIKAAAGIAKTKLANLDIVNADVNAAAAIAYSKLNLSNTIVAGDITSNAVTTAKILNANVTTAKFHADVKKDYMPRKKLLSPFSWSGSSFTAGEGLFNTTLVGVGTYFHDFFADGSAPKLITGAVSGNQAGFRSNILFAQRRHNFVLSGRFVLSTSTLGRGFLGFVDDTAAFRTGADPLNAKNGIGIAWDTSVDANFKIAHNDGSGVTVLNAWSTPTAIDTVYHNFEIIADEPNTRFQVIIDGLATSNISTDIPASTTSLAAQCFVETATTSARSMWVPVFEGHTATDL